jgi:hypothetical protein
MTIPHPFLPPRFQKLAQNRNMILLLDQDLTLHVRWEGARRYEHHPLTPQAACRLIQEVQSRMVKYRRDIQIFSRFIEQNAEQPFENSRALDPVRWPKQETPGADKQEIDVSEVVAEAEIGEALEAERMAERGGESPMPTMENEYE